MPAMDALDQAVDDAARSLELPSEAALGADALGVAVKHFLVRRADAQAGPGMLRKRLHAAEEAVREAARREATELLGAAVASLDEGESFLDRLIRRPRVRVDPEWLENAHAAAGTLDWRLWLQRSAQLAFDDLLGESVAPETRVGLTPLEDAARRQVLPGSWTHAVVCGELPGFANELFPLVLDAYAHDLHAARRLQINVVGVHHEWLDGRGRARRAIFYDHARAALHERSLASPLALDSVHLLCLGGAERSLHSELCRRLGSAVVLNPWEAACRADHKSECFAVWSAAGVPTPETLAIPSATSRSALEAAIAGLSRTAGRAGLVAQPEAGTEGRGVEAFDRPAELLRHVQALLPEGDVVIRPRVPGLRYRAGGADYSADLRVNVAWDGERYRAESGYLQVAGDPASVTSSVGRGGRIVMLSEGALEALGIRPADLPCIRRTAEAAAEALARGPDERLMLVGLDLKLEAGPGGVRPWVLDANPRPAGLSYSEFFETHEPGVSAALWGDVLRRCTTAP